MTIDTIIRSIAYANFVIRVNANKTNLCRSFKGVLMSVAKNGKFEAYFKRSRYINS